MNQIQPAKCVFYDGCSHRKCKCNTTCVLCCILYTYILRMCLLSVVLAVWCKKHRLPLLAGISCRSTPLQKYLIVKISNPSSFRRQLQKYTSIAIFNSKKFKPVRCFKYWSKACSSYRKHIELSIHYVIIFGWFKFGGESNGSNLIPSGRTPSQHPKP